MTERFTSLFSARRVKERAMLIAVAHKMIVIVWFGVTQYRDEAARLRSVRWFSIGISLACALVFLAWSQPVTLVLIGATGQALMLPFLGVVES